MLHGVALLCMALLLWRALSPREPHRMKAAITQSGALDVPLAVLLRHQADTIDVAAPATPNARTRASLRALRASGHAPMLRELSKLPAIAVSIENEWRALGGTRIQAVGADSLAAALVDGAGLIDSVGLTADGVRLRWGPVQGALALRTVRSNASAASLLAMSPSAARVLVLGDATWESKFVVAALEEGGWSVDLSLTLSPKVTVPQQGSVIAPSRARHAVVVVLPGAPAPAMASLSAFVRNGGGLVIVGSAARSASLSALRAGAPGAAHAGEAGAEASGTPRRGLDVVPVVALASGAIPLEVLDGQTTIAARRVGAGRVVQVGYENSWLWRMAGDDQSPVEHRRWWSGIIASVVSLRTPMRSPALDAEHDTLSAAPLAMMARDVGLPGPFPADREGSPRFQPDTAVDTTVLALAVVSLVASWMLRRWRGLA